MIAIRPRSTQLWALEYSYRGRFASEPFPFQFNRKTLLSSQQHAFAVPPRGPWSQQMLWEQYIRIDAKVEAWRPIFRSRRFGHCSGGRWHRSYLFCGASVPQYKGLDTWCRGLCWQHTGHWVGRQFCRTGDRPLLRIHQCNLCCTEKISMLRSIKRCTSCQVRERVRSSRLCWCIENLKGKDRGDLLLLRPLPSYHPEKMEGRGPARKFQKHESDHELIMWAPNE